METKVFKLLAVLLAAMLFPTVCHADYVKHGLEVKRLRNWAPKYLTVINNFDNVHFENAPSTLRFLSVITAVNGNSTEYMDENEFHHIIDQPGMVELSYMTKLNGENKSFTVNLKRYNGLLGDGYADSEIFYYGEEFRPQMVTDDDVDFFEFCTFDYAFGNEGEELEKKAMLSKFARRLEEKGMKRDKEKPDLYIYVTKDIDKSIEAVYHPETVSNTKSRYTSSYSAGSRTYIGSDFIRYRYNGNGQADGQSTTVTREKGDFQSHTTSDVYMQLSVLDAKRIGGKAVPKVWQITLNKRIDRNIDEKWLENMIEIFGLNYPFGSDKNGKGIVQSTTAYLHGAFTYNGKRDGNITDVIPGSLADKCGIKAGSVVSFIHHGYGHLKIKEKGFLFSSSFEGRDYLKVDGKKTYAKDIEEDIKRVKKTFYYIESDNL